MRLSEYCTSQDVDRAIAVTVDSFVGAQKVSCRKALGRAFAKYVYPSLPPCFILSFNLRPLSSPVIILISSKHCLSAPASMTMVWERGVIALGPKRSYETVANTGF